MITENALTLTDNKTGEVVEWKDQRREITSEPIRLTWDVREKKPVFECAEGTSEELNGILMAATKLFACWTDQIGQPSCMGVGDFCAEHPNTSQQGVGLVLMTDEFGPVYLQCFGLMRNWAVGLCRRAAKNNDEFSTSGVKAITTKNGTCHIPGFAK